MAKKYLTKSKPAAKQAPKKYQFAGANSSTYNQVANPYYVSGTYAEQAGQEADRYYNQAGMFGDYASESNDRARLISTEREQAKKDAIAEVELQKKQEGQAYGQELAKAAGNEALSVGKNELTKRAAAKAATLALANNAMQSGTAGVYATGVNAAAPMFATPTALSGISTASSALPTAAATTAGQSLLPGAVEVGASNVAANTGAGVGNVVAAGAGTAAKTGLMATNMSGLASAGIGLGLTGAGMLVQRKMDTDPTKFDKKEGRQNMFGDALKNAGKGFTVGAAAGSLIPGVGNVVAGTLGAVGMFGAGLVKGMKENKESKKYANEYATEEARLASEEAKRKAFLEKQGSLAAQQYNTAFVNSRLSGLQTGFGYNTSTNMNMQPTSSFYGKTGGVNVPGGQIVPIEGSDAVEFVGRKHSEGGIALGPKTEVEGGETMGPVEMNQAETGGKMSDYFFSAHLKLGGKSFAQRHKELIKSGAGQAAIQELAKRQEKKAYEEGEKDRSPRTIKEYGGPRQYKMAGPKESAMSQSNMDAANVTLRDTNKANAEAPSDQQSAAPGKRTTNSGMVKEYVNGGPKDGNVSIEEWNKMSKDDKYNLIYKLAQNAGDPMPEVTAAQWAIESGFGKQMTGSWNMFGQTTKSKDGARIATPRDPSGGSKTFANYDNLQDSITAHVKKWSPKYKDAKTPEEALMMIQNYGGKGRYAEGYPTEEFPEGDWKSYVTNTNKIIEQQKPKLKLGAANTPAPVKDPNAGFKLVSEPGYMGSIRTFYYNEKTGERRNNPLSDAEQQAAFEAKQNQDANVRNIGLGVGMAVPAGLRAIGMNILGRGAQQLLPSPKPGVSKPGPLPGLGGQPLPKPGTGVTPYTGPGTGVGSFTGNMGRPGQAYDAVPVSGVGPYLGKTRPPITIDVPALGAPKVGFPPASLLRPEMPDNTGQRAAEFIPTPFGVTPAATVNPTPVVVDPGTVDPGTEGPFPGEGPFPPEVVVDKKEDVITKEEDLVKKDDKKEGDKTIPPRNRRINGALLAGLGQLLPVGYALFKGYKTDGKLERMKGAGNVGFASIKGAVLPRVNMNAERSAVERNTVAIKNAIQNQNAGPGGIAAMMAANSKQNQQGLEIANQEQRANRELAGEEARLGMQASMANAEMAQRANMANVQNQLAVNQSNLEAGNQEARLKIDEKRYKDERTLGVLDTASGRIANIYKDYKSYEAQERLANAMDDAGSYKRFEYYEDLKKQAKDKDSEFYGKTDKELRDYSAKQYNDYIGTAKTGGIRKTRKYTSRLGELSKGKKTFNI